MEKNKIIIESKNPSLIIVDGKKYILEKETFKKIDKVEHSDKLIFKEFDEVTKKVGKFVKLKELDFDA